MKIYIFFNLKNVKFVEKRKLILDFSKNDFFQKNDLVLSSYNFIFFKNFLYKNNFKKILYLVSNVLFLKKNVLFVDSDTNYNYLPITNDIIFDRSFKKLSKVVKYFDIAAIFYLNLKKKKFIFKKLYYCNTINVSLSEKLVSKKFDLSFQFGGNEFYKYLFYLLILKVYLKIKNNL